MISSFSANVPHCKFVVETFSFHLSTISAREDQLCLHIDLHEKNIFLKDGALIELRCLFHMKLFLCIVHNMHFCHEKQKTINL